MSKGNKSNENENDVRRIKQVYPTEGADEGSDERMAGNTHPSPAGHNMTDGEENRGRSVVRAVAIAVSMIFSLALAMSVGVGLALWDSNRTIDELGAILLGREVLAASSDTVLADNKMPSGEDADIKDEADGEAIVEEDAADNEPQTPEGSDSSETAPEEDGESPEEDAADDEAGSDEDGKSPEEDMDAEAEWDEPAGYGSTILSDEEGYEGVEPADSDDEIVAEEEKEDTQDTDPDRDYPLPFSTVDESYFTDALFIGDSRLQGFGFWSGLPATYYCATGFQLYKYETTKVVQTEEGKVPIFDALPYDAFTKIYIKVGLNEMGMSEESFENWYSQLIAQLREYEPRAIIYVHGLLPVTAEKSATDKVHNNPNILVRNAALQKFAEKEKAYYLDAGPSLAAEDGSLRPEMTTDGIHLSAKYMKIWRDYLCTHAVVID